MQTGALTGLDHPVLSAITASIDPACCFGEIAALAQSPVYHLVVRLFTTEVNHSITAVRSGNFKLKAYCHAPLPCRDQELSLV
jgi:hypothetical protein